MSKTYSGACFWTKVNVIQRGVPDPQQNSMQVPDEASGDPSGGEDSDSATKLTAVTEL